ncbi:MAG: hypothetical protein ACI8UD_002822 [Planctomycetota bacterium]|jgi:hypothetical protein
MARLAATPQRFTLVKFVTQECPWIPRPRPTAANPTVRMLPQLTNVWQPIRLLSESTHPRITQLGNTRKPAGKRLTASAASALTPCAQRIDTV